MSRVTTDPIADMLTRIRNAAKVNLQTISLPHSKIKASVAKILKDNGYVVDVQVEGKDPNKTIAISLTDNNANSPITAIDRISKPGSRIYAKSGEIPVVKRGRGMIIISTSKGIMTGTEARKQNIGGELICRIY